MLQFDIVDRGGDKRGKYERAHPWVETVIISEDKWKSGLFLHGGPRENRTEARFSLSICQGWPGGEGPAGVVEGGRAPAAVACRDLELKSNKILKI